jgi:hypothetical protein
MGVEKSRKIKKDVKLCNLHKLIKTHFTLSDGKFFVRRLLSVDPYRVIENSFAASVRLSSCAEVVNKTSKAHGFINKQTN